MLTNKIFKTILLLTAITAGISNKIIPMGNNTSIVQELSIDDKNQLNLALKNGDLEAFTTLYKNNPNILQIKNSRGNTLLHFAFKKGHLNIIEFIFKSINPETFISLINAKDNEGCTPLYGAFINGHLNIIEFIYNLDENHETFISLINAKTKKDYTPLHFAFKNGHKNIIEFICNLDENHETFISLMNTKDNEGVTPLYGAFINGHLNIIEFIYNLDENHETLISLINAKLKNGCTPLHLAFKKGHLNIIEFIFKSLNPETFISLINAKDNEGCTPLQFAFLNGHLNTIEFIYNLYENHETFISLMEAKTKKDYTPLHFAFQNGHKNIIEFIHEKLSPETFISLINAKDNDGFTPLHFALQNGQDKVIKFIFNKFNSIKISDLNNKIIFTEKLLSNNKLLELILNKIKEENKGELRLDYLTDKNKDTIVSALSKNPKCLSKIIIENFDLYNSKIDKLLNMEFNPDDTVNNNPVSILIYQTLEYCKCNNITYKYNKNNFKEDTNEKSKNFINNFVNNAIVLKLLKEWISYKKIIINNDENTKHSKKTTPLFDRNHAVSSDVIQEHIMGFAGYTCFDNPKNKAVIEKLKSKEFNECLINKFANNDTSLTFFPENKKIEDNKMEIDKSIL